MDPDAHLQHVRADATALLAAAKADPTAEVPSCPGWDREKLVKHLCVPFGWVTAQAEAGPEEKRGFKDAARPAEGEDLFEFFDAATDRLIAAAGAMDPAALYPSWAGPQRAAWFARRMAHEAAVHRFDGAGGTFDAELAIDGVDELFDVFAPLVGADRFEGTGSTLHLHATDAEGGEWLATLGPEALTSERVHGKGDAAVRGTASDLYLFAWNRVPLDDRFEVLGDRAAAERWTATITF